MKKIITVIVLIFAIMICGACATPRQVDDLQSQTAEHEKAIESLTEQIKDLQNKLGDNDEKIDDLQRQNEFYEAQLRNLTGTPIEFVATSPYVDFHFEPIPREDFVGSESAYDDFIDYWEENRPYGDKNILLLKPGDYVKNYKGNYTRWEETISGLSYIEQAVSIYDEIYGGEISPYNNEMESFSLSFYWAENTIDSLENLDLYFVFGYRDHEYHSDHKDRTYYFNIYNDYECIGTCFYTANCYISYTGMYDFICDKLIVLKGAQE